MNPSCPQQHFSFYKKLKKMEIKIQQNVKNTNTDKKFTKYFLCLIFTLYELQHSAYHVGKPYD